MIGIAQVLWQREQDKLDLVPILVPRGDVKATVEFLQEWSAALWDDKPEYIMLLAKLMDDSARKLGKSLDPTQRDQFHITILVADLKKVIEELGQYAKNLRGPDGVWSHSHYVRIGNLVTGLQALLNCWEDAQRGASKS